MLWSRSIMWKHEVRQSTSWRGGQSVTQHAKCYMLRSGVNFLQYLAYANFWIIPCQHLWCFMLRAQCVLNCLVRFTLVTFKSRAERICTRNLIELLTRMCSLEARLDRIRPETISDNFFQYKWASTLRLWYCSTVHCGGQLRGRFPPSSWRWEARTMARCVLPGWGGDDDDEMMAREKITAEILCWAWHSKL